MGDSIFGDIVDGVSGFYSDNKDWINPVVKYGVGAYQNSQKDNSRDQYLDYLRQEEQKNYDSSVNAINAYNQSLAAAGAAGGGGGGGASAANRAAQQAAAGRAENYSQKQYRQILKGFKPYAQAADELLPQKQAAYEQALALQKGLAAAVSTPEQLAKIGAGKAAYETNIPLPDSVRLG